MACNTSRENAEELFVSVVLLDPEGGQSASGVPYPS